MKQGYRLKFVDIDGHSSAILCVIYQNGIPYFKAVLLAPTPWG